MGNRDVYDAGHPAKGTHVFFHGVAEPGLAYWKVDHAVNITATQFKET
jgi:hypothetical protein